LGGLSGCPGVPWLVFDFGFPQAKPSHQAPPIPAAEFYYCRIRGPHLTIKHNVAFVGIKQQRKISHHLLVGDNTNKGEVKSGKSVKSLNPLNP
jgi:hypothetical protein